MSLINILKKAGVVNCVLICLALIILTITIMNGVKRYTKDYFNVGDVLTNGCAKFVSQKTKKWKVISPPFVICEIDKKLYE